MSKRRSFAVGIIWVPTHEPRAEPCGQRFHLPESGRGGLFGSRGIIERLIFEARFIAPPDALAIDPTGQRTFRQRLKIVA